MRASVRAGTLPLEASMAALVRDALGNDRTVRRWRQEQEALPGSPEVHQELRSLATEPSAVVGPPQDARGD